MLVYNVLDLILEEAMTLEAKNLNEQISNLKEYEVILHKNIEEVDSEGWFLKHKKTGARIVLLANDDDNKVFNIGFRTPVNNDTGVPHIIEHTVLCGSKKYPVKDPFMELVKGSLNTFLNAMTYPDKTIYPVTRTLRILWKRIWMQFLILIYMMKRRFFFRRDGITNLKTRMEN